MRFKMYTIIDSDDRSFAKGLARAYGGAIIFSLPLLMTMEMWWLGFYMSPLRLAVLLSVLLPALVLLSHIAGFEETFEWRDDLLDALVAYAVGFSTAAMILAVFSVIDLHMSVQEIIGKVSLQTVPGSIGALLAQSQLGGRKAKLDAGQWTEPYVLEVLLMAVGALFLALNVAPTEEMVLISYKMSEWQALLLVLLSVALMHAFVYTVQFHGEHQLPRDATGLSTFIRYTLVGYAMALAISLYVLWTFGRTDGVSLTPALMMVLVLGFPAAIGAAAARLIL